MTYDEEDMKKLYTLLLVCGLIVVAMFLITLFWTKVRISSPLFHDVMVKSNVQISASWVDIEGRGLLDNNRDRQYLCLRVRPPYMIPLTEFGVLVPDGSVIQPDAVLVDESQAQYRLHPAVARGEDLLCYELEGDVPKTAGLNIRLRSIVTIENVDILWSGYDVRDLR